MVAATDLTVYEAWQTTLAPFLVPACVLSAWPIFMIVCSSNRTPLQLLCILALVSLADGLLGCCAYPLLHQYAFTPSQNDRLFYAGSVCYWLSGLVLGPIMEVRGARQSTLVLSCAGLLGAIGSAQEIFLFAFLGRCLSATATAGLTTLVEYVLYDEAHLRRNTARGAIDVNGSNSSNNEREEHLLDKEHSLYEGTECLGGGMLTACHQLLPLTLWASMLLGQFAMTGTPRISTGPCWAAAACYFTVAVMAWRLLLPWTASEAFKLNRLRGLNSNAASTVPERHFPGMMSGKPNTTSQVSASAASSALSYSAVGSSVESPAFRHWLRYFIALYVVSAKTLMHPKQLARHFVDILFGGLFFTMSLLWVPTLEMYDDSIPFGFIFQIFMIARFLGCTFSLPIWAVGWAEAALVALLSVTARILNTSRDYAVPVTIMLAGVAMHLLAGVVQTTGSLWRAEYPSATAPLTFLFVMKALTGISGWVFLNVIDGKYMEDVFVFEARWVYGLMWMEAVALAQYIARRAAQHREAAHLLSNGVRTVAGGPKEESFREDSSNVLDATAAVSVEADLGMHHHVNASTAGGERRAF